MAVTTLMDAATANATGTGEAITGDFDVTVTGDMAGGVLEIQRSVDDVDGNYQGMDVKGQFRGPGHVTIRNVGTNYYRANLSGVLDSLAPASATMKVNQ